MRAGGVSSWSPIGWNNYSVLRGGAIQPNRNRVKQSAMGSVVDSCISIAVLWTIMPVSHASAVAWEQQKSTARETQR